MSTDTAYSYTAATGKRPFQHTDGRWIWHDWQTGKPVTLDWEVYCTMYEMHRGGRYFPTESAALAAADQAYLRAVADGAMAPLEAK